MMTFFGGMMLETNDTFECKRDERAVLGLTSVEVVLARQSPVAPWLARRVAIFRR